MPNSTQPPGIPDRTAWVQFHFQINKDQVEQLEDALLAAGAVAVILKDQKDEPVFEPNVGETPLWQHLIVTGLFNASVDTDVILDVLRQQWPNETLPDYQLEIIEDRNWEREWMVHYKPMRFGNRLWVCPSGMKQPDPEATNLILDPGLAFGTGTHPTTALCLEWLNDQELQGKTVLDFGCGSGILGIAALLLGAKQVIAIDNDPQALSATLDNAGRNHIDTSALIIRHPDELDTATTEVDIVIANILAGPLLELATKIAGLVKTNGYLALSGILQGQCMELNRCYSQWFNLQPPVYRKEWALISGRKNTR